MPNDGVSRVPAEDSPALPTPFQIELPGDGPREAVEAVEDPGSEKDPDGYGFGV